MDWKREVAKTILGLLAFSCTPCTQGWSEQPLPIIDAEIRSTFTSGRELENENRWQEAIQVYESTFKKYVLSSEIKEETKEDLKRRLDICRIHHDVIRRYADSSFTNAVDQMAPNQALDLYSEVLGKLELNYVEPIRLEDLLKKGTAYLEVALTEPDFLSKNLNQTKPEVIEQFRLNVHKMVLGRPIKSRVEARAMVLAVATAAQKQIGLNPTVTIHEYVAGAVGLLDPYSGYMTPGELTEVLSQIEGNLIGLGVELWAEKDDLRIVEVFEGSPASVAGLRTGDRILQVGNVRTAEVSAKRAADLLRGPENSEVKLLIARGEQAPNEVLVTRRRVEVPSVSAVEMIDLDSRVAYIRITNFQKTTIAEVDQALWKLNRSGMKSLIIDLRRNPGGLLDAAVEVADRVLTQGAIVTTRGRNGNENPQGSHREALCKQFANHRRRTNARNRSNSLVFRALKVLL